MSVLSKIKNNIKGDQYIWILVIIISVFSVPVVYSASSNYEYIGNIGTTTSYIFKHIGFILIGLSLMYGVANIKYEIIGKLIGLLGGGIFLVLLIIAFFSGQTIEGASASRWITIPLSGMTIQPSIFVYLCLIVYLCRYLSRNASRQPSLGHLVGYVFFPISLVVILVGKDNGSTALMILFTSVMVLFFGGLKLKYIAGFIGSFLVVGILFIGLALSTNLIKNNRIETWKSRIETFFDNTKDESQLTNEEKERLKNKTYQIDNAKQAIVHGGFFGKGPGKSALKQRLPQSASDFVFAIIIEEYGLFGAGVLLLFYGIILMRIVLIAPKVASLFGVLLVLSMGIMFFIQIAANVMVAVNLIPVTGQSLPLISYGGSSIIVTYIQLGLVQNVSTRVRLKGEEELDAAPQALDEIQNIA